VVEGEHHRRRPVPQPELGEQVVDVRLDRSLADEQLSGDLAVSPAVADEHQNLTLTAGQGAQARPGGFCVRAGRRRWR
jgi:hypothetical protein